MNSETMTLVRGMSVGLLVLMVVKGIAWLIDPHPEATASIYALQIGTVAICGATAWVTWRPHARLQRRMHAVMGRHQ